MASVRKKPLKFKDGGRVPVLDATNIEDVSRNPAPVDDNDPDYVLHTVRKMQQAEEMTVNQYIDGLTDLSESKRDFLKANPEFTRRENVPVLAQRNAETQRLGIADDSPEFFDYLKTGVLRADDGRFVAEEEPTPVIERRLTPPAPAPMPTTRRAMPMTAPVSRDAPSFSSGQRAATNTLTREEVQMAHLSYRDIPKVEAEKLYLQQKQRLHAMRADGQYPMPERG